MITAVLIAEAGHFGLKSWTRASWTPVFLLFGAVFVIAFVFFGWALWWRKPRKRKHSYHHLPDHSALPHRHERRSGLGRLFQRKRHRRKHRQERPVNPTLAQIGGLPPPRQDGEPPHN
jgi:hypothetical protein